jgi:hypothetical protein
MTDAPEYLRTGVPRAAALDEATITPLQEMEFWLGVSHQGSTFASARHCRRLNSFIAENPN